MVEPCRSQVEEELAMDRVLTCTTATYICSAEPACNTALQYYNNYCADMFTGETKYKYHQHIRSETTHSSNYAFKNIGPKTRPFNWMFDFLLKSKFAFREEL